MRNNLIIPKIFRFSHSIRFLWPLLPISLFLASDRIFPLPLPGRNGYVRLVTAADGRPLTAFSDSQGVWRYPVSPDHVSPIYLASLLAFEDRWFYKHPGVNPLACGRALFQNLRHGRIVSGGSTLTMQVARIIEPHPRSMPGKLRQMFRALQLEWHLSKYEILTLYLNHAPFGGTVAGVAAASHTYLGKGVRELTTAEAALLVALPQAPSRLRPDRHPEAAQLARDKVLRRLAEQGIITSDEALSAMRERVVAESFSQPRRAPLLAERLKRRSLAADRALISSIDAGMQSDLEGLVRETVDRLPQGVSAAMVVVENDTLLARAYIGSSHYGNNRRFGFIDMVQSVRSPGSTLKPFLYGIALDEGLIHSESLLADAPRIFSSYRPANFGELFNGPVSVREALQRSLNVPAVQVLEALGPGRFAAGLEGAGLELSFPKGGGPGLPMILGGVGVKLIDLTGAFTALANDGLAGRVRLTPDDPLLRKRLMSPGAAWIIREILLDSPPPDRMRGDRWLKGPVRLAWKTGTSYGFRDAWAVGVGARYTIGVWLGRPDGTPVAGQYGLASAAPLLFAAAARLTESGTIFSSRPETVREETICWPLGRPFRPEDAGLCHERRQAFILRGQTPPSLTVTDDVTLEENPLTVRVNRKTVLRVGLDCGGDDVISQRIALWPRNLEPWLALNQRRSALLPAWDSLCPPPPAGENPIRITSLINGQTIRPAGQKGTLPAVGLQSQGGTGRRFWLVDGEFRHEETDAQPPFHTVLATGRHRISVIDESGASAQIDIFVDGG